MLIKKNVFILMSMCMIREMIDVTMSHKKHVSINSYSFQCIIHLFHLKTEVVTVRSYFRKCDRVFGRLTTFLQLNYPFCNGIRLFLEQIINSNIFTFLQKRCIVKWIYDFT